MAINIHNLIAAINPEVFCDFKLKNKVKSIAKEKGYLAAAEVAKPKEADYLDLRAALNLSPFLKTGLKYPISKYTLTYDIFGENLEPIYFLKKLRNR